QPDNLNTQPGFFQREPRELLREKRKKKEYFDDFARQFAPVAPSVLRRATLVALVARTGAETSRSIRQRV
ncbi:MAG: hypothetical protein FWD31_04970, partial [Planctomycetaceae bacterium]|nr:hypothetical protein [Planctomycetaceae bacterium]